MIAKVVKMQMTQDAASTLALTVLGWLLSEDELLGVFLGSTGASADDLREQAADPTFQASVLEFLTMDDASVTRFCDSHGHDYMAPLTARQVLLGEAGRHWT